MAFYLRIIMCSWNINFSFKIFKANVIYLLQNCALKQTLQHAGDSWAAFESGRGQVAQSTLEICQSLVRCHAPHTSFTALQKSIDKLQVLYLQLNGQHQCANYFTFCKIRFLDPAFIYKRLGYASIYFHCEYVKWLIVFLRHCNPNLRK